MTTTRWTVDPLAKAAANFALAQQGKPYVWGGTGPYGYDCSGLVYAAYRSVGISIPRETYQQALVGKGITLNPSVWKRGDLLLVDTGVGEQPAHVQMVIDGLTVVEAPHTGGYVQTIKTWATSYPYSIYAVRRVVGYL